jgi:hypothetical protein
MKLNTREDIEAPLDFVYAALSDFEAWERAGLRRGADVTRTDKTGAAAPGASWLVVFTYRGKLRKLAIRLTEMVPSARLAFTAQSPVVEGGMEIDLVALSAKRTRVTIGTEVRARTLAARLVLQSLKLAKGKVKKRYDTRIGQMCNEIENRYRTPQMGR